MKESRPLSRGCRWRSVAHSSPQRGGPHPGFWGPRGFALTSVVRDEGPCRAVSLFTGIPGPSCQNTERGIYGGPPKTGRISVVGDHGRPCTCLRVPAYVPPCVPTGVGACACVPVVCMNAETDALSFNLVTYNSSSLCNMIVSKQPVSMKELRSQQMFTFTYCLFSRSFYPK